MSNRIKEHLLLGSEAHDTWYTACGIRTLERRGSYVVVGVCGLSQAWRRKDFARMAALSCTTMCRSCKTHPTVVHAIPEEKS